MDMCDQPGLRPIEEAMQQLFQSIKPLAEHLHVPILESLGQVLAEDISSNLDVPPSDNSAMDGYAVRVADLANTDTLTLMGASLAGQPLTTEIQAGECARITTGGVIPKGADAVMMQENVQVEGDKVRFLVKPKLGQSIRRAGESIKCGQVVMNQGTKLSPSHVGLLASLGVAKVKIVRPLNVAVLSTGDELVEPGCTLGEGQIFDSNRPAIIATLQHFGAHIKDFGIIKDDKTSLHQAFSEASSWADAIITSGGVSVGDADYTKEVLEELGSIAFWKLAIKPGKPFAFGKIGQALFFGLPGNPVSAMVTLHQLVLPALQHQQNGVVLARNEFCAVAAELFKKRPGRTDYQRALFWTDSSGVLNVKPCGPQGSGIFSSITQANCFAILPKDSGDLLPGEQVTIQPFDMFIA